MVQVSEDELVTMENIIVQVRNAVQDPTIGEALGQVEEILTRLIGEATQEGGPQAEGGGGPPT